MGRLRRRQHLYWRLADELLPAEVEDLNRRLCHRPADDPDCCKNGRIVIRGLLRYSGFASSRSAS